MMMSYTINSKLSKVGTDKGEQKVACVQVEEASLCCYSSFAQLSGRSATCRMDWQLAVCASQLKADLVALACDGCIGNELHPAATDGHVRLPYCGAKSSMHATWQVTVLQREGVP